MKIVCNLVFYAQSSSAVISGQDSEDSEVKIEEDSEDRSVFKRKKPVLS